MNRRQRKIANRAINAQNKPVPVAPTPAKPSGNHILQEALSQMRQKPEHKSYVPTQDMYEAYVPMKGVLPAKSTAKQLAMDAGFSANNAFNAMALENINGALYEGYAFPGFQLLAQWSQVSEFRRPVEIMAREMTRKWIKFVAVGDEDKSDKIKIIEAEFKRLNVQAITRELIQQEGLFGRGQLFFDMGLESSQLDDKELLTELVESPSKVGIGALKRLVTVDAVWSYPNRYNANDPLDPTFYKPESWFVMGKEIHSSRLMTVITRKVPDILKPAYAFAGMSLPQLMKPYVDNWLRARQTVSDLMHAFTVWNLATDMGSILNSGGAQQLQNRAELFNLMRDNNGLNVTNKETELFSNVSAPITGLDKLQAQAQEQQCAPAGIPLVYMTGITPAGLNATSEGEIETFQDTISAAQEIYTPLISKIMNLVQLSTLGEIDKDIAFIWEPLKVVTEADKAMIEKTQADAAVAYIDAGVISPGEERNRLAAAESSMYHGLDLSIAMEPPADPANDPEMTGPEHDHKDDE